MEARKKVMSNHPDARGEIKRVFVDGDHVILHSHWHGLSDNPRGEAVVDIFRLEGGKVLEHWDVIQPIPETSANSNTMFYALIVASFCGTPHRALSVRRY